MEKRFELEPNPTKTRHSGIDLLRLIAMFLICFSHANQTFRANFDTSLLTYFSNAISVAIHPLGTCGNILFVICSSYFLADKSRTRGEKALGILFDSTLISVSILIVFLLSGQQLGPWTILHQVFPDVFNMNWFVPCYVIFYLLSPIIVAGLRQLSKKAHFAVVLFGLVVYGGLEMVQLTPVCSLLFQFYNILCIVAFVKWHCPNIFSHRKANLLVFLVGFFLTYALHIGALVLGESDFPIAFTFTSMLAPILLISLVSLFNVFATMKFQNRLISYLGPCSLFVYVIHENFLLRTITRVRYYDWAIGTYGIQFGVVFIAACGIFMFVIGLILAVVYKETFHRLTAGFAKIVSKGIRKMFDWLYCKVFTHADL